MQMYPKAKEQAAKTLNTLAAMISGIVGSKSTHLWRCFFTVCYSVELASLLQAITALSKLDKLAIRLDLRLELKGEISSEHAITVVLSQLQQSVTGLKLKDTKG